MVCRDSIAPPSLKKARLTLTIINDNRGIAYPLTKQITEIFSYPFTLNANTLKSLQTNIIRLCRAHYVS